MIVDKFGLQDAEYWSDPWRTRKAVQRPLMQKGEETLLIGAPGTVALNERDTFPVAILWVRKLHGGGIDLRRTAIITAMDLDTDELRAGMAFDRPRPQAPPPRQRGKNGGSRNSFAIDPTAMLSEGHTLDLARRLRLPVQSGNYLVTLIWLDKTSNRCRMKLVDSSLYENPAVAEFLRSYQAERLEPPRAFPPPGRKPASRADEATTEVQGGPVLPSYEKLDESPQVPPDVGIQISVERVNVLQSGSRCLLLGSYRLPIQPHHVVRTVDVEGKATPARPETAVVPVTLLLTGSVDIAPTLVKLALPSHGPIQTTKAGSMATGYFALDLCQMADLLTTPQTHFIHAFSGEVMAGPFATAFVRLPAAWTRRASA